MAQRPPSALARLHCPRSIHIVHFCANGVSVACMKSKCCWTICCTCRTCSVRGSSCSCARTLGQITPCGTSHPRMCGRTPRGATEPCARRITTLQACLGEKTAEGEPLASTAWAVAATPATLGGLGLHLAMRLLQHGVPRPTRWVIGTCATAFGVGMCACTRSAVVWSVSRTEGRSAFAATRWQECPTWSRATPGARKPGLATGLTAGSSTHRVPAHTLLSRSKHCYHE